MQSQMLFLILNMKKKKYEKISKSTKLLGLNFQVVRVEIRQSHYKNCNLICTRTECLLITNT